MPQYQNCQFVLTLTYSSVQPAATAIYHDTAGNVYYITATTGSGATAQYAVIGPMITPALGTLTKNSGTGDSTVTLTAVTNQQVQTLNFTRIEAGQTTSSPEWFATLPFGVIQVSNTPTHNNTVYSGLITSSGSYTVPSTLTGNYRITFFMNQTSTGSISIQPNGIGVATILIGGNSYALACADRTIGSVFWVVTGSVTATILVETY